MCVIKNRLTNVNSIIIQVKNKVDNLIVEISKEGIK